MPWTIDRPVPNIVSIESWHAVGAVGEPAFQNSWVNFAGPTPALAYRKLPDGTVELRGSVKNGTVGNTVFTLPAGYRPPAQVRLPAYSNTGATSQFGLIFIDTTGIVQVYYVNNIEVDFDGVRFSADPATWPTGPQGPAGNPATPVVTVDPVHFVGAAGEPAFANSWVNFNAGGPTRALRSVGFWKDPAGWVHLTGIVKSGTVTSAAFTLPVGYRPAAQYSYEVNSNELRGEVLVDSAGNVIPQVGNNVYFFLEGISFDTGQTTFPAGAASPPLVTVLPVSPFNGQEIYYQNAAMAAKGVIWQLRYNTASGSAYKWEFLGGPPLATTVGGSIIQTTSATPFTATAITGGPTVTLPLNGDYELSTTAVGNAGTATTDYRITPYIGGSSITSANGPIGSAYTASTYQTFTAVYFPTAKTAGQVVDQRILSGTASLAMTIFDMALGIRPIRVG